MMPFELTRMMETSSWSDESALKDYSALTLRALFVFVGLGVCPDSDLSPSPPTSQRSAGLLAGVYQPGRLHGSGIQRAPPGMSVDQRRARATGAPLVLELRYFCSPRFAAPHARAGSCESCGCKSYLDLVIPRKEESRKKNHMQVIITPWKIMNIE